MRGEDDWEGGRRLSKGEGSVVWEERDKANTGEEIKSARHLNNHKHNKGKVHDKELHILQQGHHPH